MSSVGIPSVMQTTSATPASAASMIASAAKAGGTKITDAFAPVDCHGVDHRVEHRPPFVYGAALPGRHAAHDLGAVILRRERVECPFATGDALHDQSRVSCREESPSSGLSASDTTVVAASLIVSAVAKFSPLSASILFPSSTLVPFMRITIGTGTPSSLTAEMTPRGEHVTAQNAAEDVDQHGFDVLVGHQNLERVANLLRVGAAAHIEKVRRRAARELDDVHRGHRQSGAIDHAADVAIEADVVERVLRRLDFERILFGKIAKIAHLGVAEQRVVVEIHLRVEREQFAALGDDERVDFEQRGVDADKGVV